MRLRGKTKSKYNRKPRILKNPTYGKRGIFFGQKRYKHNGCRERETEEDAGFFIDYIIGDMEDYEEIKH